MKSAHLSRYDGHLGKLNYTVHEVLQAGILEWIAILSSGSHFVRTLHCDPSILGGPTQHGS